MTCSMAGLGEDALLGEVRDIWVRIASHLAQNCRGRSARGCKNNGSGPGCVINFVGSGAGADRAFVIMVGV